MGARVGVRLLGGDRTSYLCDVINCVGKTGDAVLDVLQQQWATVGCYKDDCVAGCGDGGGENEGYNGIHAQLERNRADYVRRRCLGHLPWRVADQGLVAMGAVHDATQAISAYLHDGPTWNRLKAIAVHSVASGGLALFAEGSRAYHDVFSQAPPRSLAERPDTTVALLKWLTARQDVLMKVVKRDSETRTLSGKQNILARDSLTLNADWAYRRVAYVMLKKALFVYYYIEGKEHVCMHIGLDCLFARAQKIITSTECDEKVMEFLGIDSGALVSRGIVDASTRHWVEVAMKTTPGLTDAEMDAGMDLLHAFHSKVARKMSSHLSLNAANILRNTWVAAKILSTNPSEAKAAANQLLHAPSLGILRLRLDQCTAFEAAILANSVVMQQLCNFADDPFPKCVWQKGELFADLFVFIADRFAGAPDHVLDCESVHAQWKFLETIRRGMKFKLLNALLKLRHYRFTNRRLPSFDELEVWFEELSQGRAARYRALVAAGQIHPRLVPDQLYQERFRLRAVDVALMRQADDDSDGDGADESAQGVEISFANYVRFLFQPDHLYSFTSLADTKFVYIAENKSVAYRDKQKPDHVIGRPLTVVWYEQAPPDFEIEEHVGVNEIILHPCAGNTPELPLQNMSLAELSITAGFYPAAILPDHTERDVEIMHEAAILRHSVERFDSRATQLSSGVGWCRICDRASGVDLEWYAFNQRNVNDLTKMALARALQTRDNLTDDERNRIWQLPKPTLLAAFQNPAGAGAVAAKAAAKPAAKAAAKLAAKAAAKPAAKAAPAGAGRGVGGKGRGRGRHGRGRG